jgi:hypothetical protein
MVSAMHNTIKTMFALFAMAIPSLASAQTEQPAPAPATEVAPAPAPEAAPAPAPAPEAALAPAAAESVLDERVAGMESKLSGVEENLTGVQSTVDGLKKIKLSGFIQSRFERRQNAIEGATADTKGALTTGPSDRFYIKRAYLKTAYEGRNAEYMLQFDGSDGFALKDAEATFVDTWSPFKIRLTVGQFKLPFGYEILQSDTARELPERSLIIGSKGYFDGERDRGVRLQARYEFLRLAVALVNGNGIKDKTYGTHDPNKFKDVVGRLGVDFGSVTGGLSGYYGRGGVDDTKGAAATDPAAKAGTVTYGAAYRRVRLGADLQTYIDVPSVGGLALKGEVIWGKDTSISETLNNVAVAANPCKTSAKLGWMLTAVQNIGDSFGVAMRLDQLDPSLKGSLDGGCTDATVLANADSDRTTTLGGAFLYHVSNNLKLTLAYEHPFEQSHSKDNDVFTAQLLARF